MQLRCALLKAPSRSTKGQGQQRTAAAQQASGGGAAAGLGRGMMREQPGSQQDPKIHTQKRKCKKCAWHPPQAQNGQSK